MDLVGRLRSAVRTVDRAVGRRGGVHTDGPTGLLYERCFGHRVFIKSRRDHQPPRVYRWLCEDVYFGGYLPDGDDVVVDIGAGYGHEALYVHDRAPHVRYIGVEIQPIVYECLANTIGPFRPQLLACPFAISALPSLTISSLANYEEVAAVDGGVIDVPTLGWSQFLERYDITRVALLKVNIEGGERDLLKEIDLSVVDRLIVSAHDFRADLGHGEQFRTRSDVIGILESDGFSCSPLGDGGWWGDWIFAARAR